MTASDDAAGSGSTAPGRPLPGLTWPARAARAGTIAALLMLLAQLVWRLAWTPDGAKAFPELIVEAVARLTPLGLFGFATETFGSLAQNALFLAVLVGVVLVGRWAGSVAGRIAGGYGGGIAARLGAGLLVAAALLLFVLVGVLPVARLGFFGAGSDDRGELLVQLGSTFALFGIAWAVLSGSPALAGAAEGAGGAVDRRALLGRVGTAALALGVGGLGLRLTQPGGRVDPAASEQAAREIAATAEARAAGAGAAGGDVAAAPTSAPLPRLETGPAAGGQPGAGSAPAEAAAPQPPRQAVAAPAPAVDFARLEAEAGLTPKLTAVADFYHVSKNIRDPEVDGEGWTLTIDGLVDRPLALDYEQLVARATTRKITTLGCISNEIGGDLIGTAEWTGVVLAELLGEAGVKPGAIKLKFSCADDYEDSITVERAMDPDTMVVVGMNGEPLTPDHGYPARLIVPGIYGMKNVKWVERIELVDHDFQGYWQERGWSDPAPYQIWGRVDIPESGTEIAAGPATAAGLASAGDRGIGRVEVSLDDGETWGEATLEPAINAPLTWVRWAFPFAATPGKHPLRVRITDGEGTVAPEQERPPLPDGATGWPSRTVRVEG